MRRNAESVRLARYRAPAPNMSVLAQIASPVLTEPPTQIEFQTMLGDILRGQNTPRVRKAVEYVLSLADEILGQRERGVAVTDLPRLFMEPESFSRADSILERHERAHSHIRQGLENLLKNNPIVESSKC